MLIGLAIGGIPRMRKHVYEGSNDVERINIRGGRAIRRGWFLFESEEDALVFFHRKCGSV